jgi:hypothetical protein
MPVCVPAVKARFSNPDAVSPVAAINVSHNCY